MLQAMRYVYIFLLQDSKHTTLIILPAPNTSFIFVGKDVMKTQCINHVLLEINFVIFLRDPLQSYGE